MCFFPLSDVAVHHASLLFAFFSVDIVVKLFLTLLGFSYF